MSNDLGTRTVKPAIPRRSGLIAVTLSLITPTAGGMRPPAPLRVTIEAFSNDYWDPKDPRTLTTLNLLPEIASNEDLSTNSLIAQGPIQSRVIATLIAPSSTTHFLVYLNAR